MNNGVTIEDINTTYIYEDVEIGMDTVIHPNTTIKSGVVIGEDCNIGPNAYIREGCKLADKVKVGSFVEIKKSNYCRRIKSATLIIYGRLRDRNKNVILVVEQLHATMTEKINTKQKLETIAL